MIEKHVMNNLWIRLFIFLGQVGDWKNQFSAEEDAAFDEHYCKMMADCPIPIRFTIWMTKMCECVSPENMEMSVS